MRKLPMTRRELLRWSALAGALLVNPLRSRRALAQPPAPEPPEPFPGPFSSWSNLQAKYGARGDGKADDTHAIQTALDDLGDQNSSPVLWVPAGTYRITKTLQWTRNIGDGWMSILGAHPETTSIVWDGAPDGIMFQTHNVNNSRWGRLTWDGKNRASCAVQHTSSGSSSGNEHADERFRDVGIGIRGGTMQTKMVAEMSILRCQFSNCSRAGISIQNPNALDWWIWHSLFQDCYAGVTSGYGQGSFHVFNSIFKRSTFADTFINFASYHVLADNYSLNSRAFCLAPYSWNQLELVIQRNTILDPTLGPNPPEPPGGGLAELFPYDLPGPIATKYFGPMLLLDNVIRSRPGHKGPVVEIGEDMLAAGNTFTVPNALLASKRLIEFDNTTSKPETIVIPEPALPPTPTRFAGKVMEVNRGASAEQIQAQMDAAGKEGGGTIVHIPYGVYPLTQSLVIRTGYNISVVGDGRTILDWKGAEDGIALDVRAPVRVVLRDFVLRQDANHATGLAVSGFSGINSRAQMQAVQVRGFTHGLDVQHLDDAVIELRDFSSTNANFDPPIAPARSAVFVGGGIKRALGESAPGRVNWFSGASSGTVPSYGVDQGGTLLVRAVWYEGRAAQVANFTGTGEFTWLGGLIARYGESDAAQPAIEVGGFRGRVAILAVNFADAAELSPTAVALRVQGVQAAMRVLALGVCGWTKRSLRIENHAPRGEVGFLMTRSSEKAGDYVIARDDEYKGTDTAPYTRFLREMLAAARREKPLDTVAVPEDATDLRLMRVYVLDFDEAIQIDSQVT